MSKSPTHISDTLENRQYKRYAVCFENFKNVRHACFLVSWEQQGLRSSAENRFSISASFPNQNTNNENNDVARLHTVFICAQSRWTERPQYNAAPELPLRMAFCTISSIRRAVKLKAQSLLVRRIKPRRISLKV